MNQKKNLNRRDFINASAAASVAFTILPRHVLGGRGYVAPSDKLRLAYIGCGTQGLREMCQLITNPQLQIVTVCDCNKMSTNYLDWSPNEIRDSIREVIGDPNWGAKLNGIPGGRDVGKELVEKYYSKAGTPMTCPAYSDFRELLDKEKNIDAVKIMTPDHLHAYISIAAMKAGKHVVIHKPIGNRMYEARISIETARKTGVSTHLLAWSKARRQRRRKKMDSRRDK
jgi:predicted dehydrogenase